MFSILSFLICHPIHDNNNVDRRSFSVTRDHTGFSGDWRLKTGHGLFIAVLRKKLRGFLGIIDCANRLILLIIINPIDFNIEHYIAIQYYDIV